MRKAKESPAKPRQRLHDGDLAVLRVDGEVELGSLGVIYLVMDFSAWLAQTM